MRAVWTVRVRLKFLVDAHMICEKSGLYMLHYYISCQSNVLTEVVEAWNSKENIDRRGLNAIFRYQTDHY